MTLGATPWVDRSLREVLPKLASDIPPTWFPLYKGGKAVEYGCGHYGCVMPTNEPGLVCKVTTDVSEAAFVARALTLEETSGIVEYKKIFATGGTHRSRPMFILWRTEAEDVGDWGYARTHGNDSYARRVSSEADSFLMSFKNYAHIVRAYVHPRLRKLEQTHQGEPLALARAEFMQTLWDAYERYEPIEDGRKLPAYVKGVQRVGVALRTCLYISQEMQGNPSLYRVGEALGHYLENGILLADVHANNIGIVDETPIITDPGHAVEFNPRWSNPPQIVVL